MILSYQLTVRNFSGGMMLFKSFQNDIDLDCLIGTIIQNEAPETSIYIIERTKHSVILKIVRRNVSRIVEVKPSETARYSVSENAFGFDFYFTLKGV